jgi:hypothetical protein
MSDELKLAKARQRLKNLMVRENAKAPNLEPGAFEGPLEITKTEQSEEIITERELYKLLSGIIKDTEQVMNIMEDTSIVNDETTPLLVENFNEMVKDLKKTYKGSVSFPLLKGFIKRYSARLLKQINYETSSGKQVVKNESDYRNLMYEIDNLKKLFGDSKIVFTKVINPDPNVRALISDFYNKPAFFFSKTDKIEQFQNLFIDNVLKIDKSVNPKQTRLINSFVDRNPTEIKKLYADLMEGKTENPILESNIYESSADMISGLDQRDIDRLDLVKAFTDKEVRPKIKGIPKTRADELLSLLRTILTENLVNNKPGDIELIISDFDKGIKNPLNKMIGRLEKKDDTIQLAPLIDTTLPLVTKWRNDKINYLLTQPEYRNNPELIRPKVEELSKQMFGYGVGSKKKRY